MPITLKNVSHEYNPGTTFASFGLKDISLRIESGESVGIIGPTGSGKSTLLQHINGLLKPTAGELEVEGIRITRERQNLSELRKNVGLVFQYPEYQLFEETIAKDIAFGPSNLGLPKEEVDARVRDAMEIMGLDYSELAERSPFEISGGQKRRVAIAGVLAMKPKVLMLDEPTAGLDPLGRSQLLETLKTLHETRKITLIIISHSMEEIATIASRIILMKGGQVMLDRPVESAFEDVPFFEECGMDVPVLSRVISELRAAGKPFSRNFASLEEAKREILSAVNHA